MARTLSRPSTLYQPGTFGPFSVDSLTKADTDALEMTMTVEGWPDVPLLATVSVRWSTGDGADFTIPGRPLNKDGTPRSNVVMRVDVPTVAGPGRKADVASGTVSVTLAQAARTAITLRAV